MDYQNTGNLNRGKRWNDGSERLDLQQRASGAAIPTGKKRWEKKLEQRYFMQAI